MKQVLSVAVGVVAATMLSLTVLAQTPAPPPTGQQPTAQQPPQPKTGTPPAPGAVQQAMADQVTVVGCIQRESDYRRAADKGRGGAAGTGVGAGDEFVLTNASMSTQGVKTDAPVTDTAYELTGPNEEKVKEHVGKRVQITGKLKPAEVTSGGKPTGGATAGTPPTGVDVASKDLKLRELEIASVTSATGTCPAP